MIKQFDVKGFQAYKKKVTIKLSKGVNIIVGTSGTGKSSIVRAIKWALQNRPQGDRFRNKFLDGKDPVDVGLKFSKGEFTRSKSPSANTYIIKGQKEPLQALRTDVPTEISNISRMKDINIQGQHPTEQYFLLTESPGQVAKMFNDVSGLSIVDKTIASVNSKKRTASADIKVYDQEIKESTEELESTEWVPEALKEGRAIEEQSIDIKIQMKAVKIGKELIGGIEEIDKKLDDKYEGIDEALQDVYVLEKKKDKLNKSLGKSQVLNGIVNELNDTEKKYKAYESLPEALKSLESLKNYRESNINDTQADLNKLESTLRQINNAKSDIQDMDEEVNKAQKVFSRLLKTEECPMCGRKG